MNYMFYESEFNQPLKLNISNVKNISCMFYKSKMKNLTLVNKPEDINIKNLF